MSKNQKILIIDDEKVILDLTSIILRNRGYRVICSADAVAAIGLIEQERPELVLLDYMMPMMDGLTALREIKSRFPDTYVIMFTGKGSEEIAVKLMKAGANDYILKPFNNQDLADRIENVLRMREVELRNRDLLREREKLLREIEMWNRELEKRVEEKTEALRKAQAEIMMTEKVATLGFLSAGMAHEIRNPLNSISLFTQLIRSGLDDPEKLEYSDKILSEVSRIDDILRKLLSASRRPMYELRETEIHRVIDSALAMFAPQIAVQGIEVEKVYRATAPPIQADSSEIEQVFSNLFLNAIQEMANGGRLCVELDVEGEEIRVAVTDTGGGIPKENLSSIFDPFFTTKSTGTGFGLPVVLRIVKSYEGRISVESDPPRGTTFTVRFPLRTTKA